MKGHNLGTLPGARKQERRNNINEQQTEQAAHTTDGGHTKAKEGYRE